MIQETSKIWMDGQFLEWKDATVHVLTHTLHYGLGIFEGIRCYRTERGPAIFRLDDHVSRLFDSAHIAQIMIPYEEKVLNQAVRDTVRVNNLSECYIRPLVFLGYGDMGLYTKDNPVRVAIAAWPWATYLGEEGIKSGIKVKVASFPRHHVNISLTRAKITGYYVNSQLAKREAKSSGYDEAVLLDTEGYVAEGSGENIFIVRKGVINTTPLTCILEGITRDTVLEIARRDGKNIREDRFTRDELYIADEAFLTGTAAEITPIVNVDGRRIGKGIPGPVTQHLQKEFFKIVQGTEEAYKNWLTYL
jgi:branched-chain amino acid aminotransferase